MFRSRSVTEGGPDGGDGGRGGHVIIEGNKQLWTLLHLRYKPDDQESWIPSYWQRGLGT